MGCVDRQRRWGWWDAGNDEAAETLQFMQHAIVEEELSKEKTAQGAVMGFLGRCSSCSRRNHRGEDWFLGVWNAAVHAAGGFVEEKAAQRSAQGRMPQGRKGWASKETTKSGTRKERRDQRKERNLGKRSMLSWWAWFGTMGIRVRLNYLTVKKEPLKRQKYFPAYKFFLCAKTFYQFESAIWGYCEGYGDVF